MRVLVATVPLQGHTGPLLPLVRELVARGHDVRWLTAAAHRPLVEETGARHLPLTGGQEEAAAAWLRREPGRWSPQVLRLAADLEHLFIRTLPAWVADLEAAAAAAPVDVVVGDVGLAEALRATHERGGAPFVTVGVSPLLLHDGETAPYGLGLPPPRGRLGRCRVLALEAVVHRGVMRRAVHALAEERRGLGLPEHTAGVQLGPVSPFLHLQSGVPSLEYPRRALPASLRFLGHLAAPVPPGLRRARPPWEAEVSAAHAAGRPVVLVTQGTVATDPGQLLRPAVRGLTGNGYLVVVGTGVVGRTTLPFALSERAGRADDVRVGGFLPVPDLLPHVDVVVTNGGYGGVQAALAAGVPLVVAGRSEDKAEVAARVAWAGAGLDLRTQTPSARQVARAVARVLDDPRYRARARALAAEYAALDAPVRGAGLLEELVGGTTPRPPVQSRQRRRRDRVRRPW